MVSQAPLFCRGVLNTLNNTPTKFHFWRLQESIFPEFFLSGGVSKNAEIRGKKRPTPTYNCYIKYKTKIFPHKIKYHLDNTFNTSCYSYSFETEIQIFIWMQRFPGVMELKKCARLCQLISSPSQK